ncbi:MULTISPECIES: glycosyltransferase family 32 protein [Agrobacterium]|uniref:glycosyltransferase family 32 protein n=1 Tax=Agrobacterium TaxID=357 RepID=UPI00249F3313|nr:glycosyltransferase [Agrobacterium sp. InxBP2]MCW8280490.1 mannosyltransferase [Agrobacterium sp. InxBP2]
MAKHDYNPVAYRAIKIGGNIVKVIFSIDLFLRPGRRKTLPAHQPARRHPKSEKAIPRIIWQTNYSNRVTTPIYANFLFNRWLTPEFEYRYHDDEACQVYIDRHFPGRYADAFRRLQVGAAKADFWRILVLLQEGGIYLDIDSNFAARPEDVIGTDEEAVFIAMKEGEITNYFMASKPGHPALKLIADRIAQNIEEGTLVSVYDMTGPTVVHAVVKELGLPVRNYREMCTQGQFTNKRAQYADKKDGAWWAEQAKTSIIKN